MCCCGCAGDVVAYNGRMSMVLGLVTIALQTLAIGLNSEAAAIDAEHSSYVPNVFITSMPSVWNGILIVLSALFAVAAGMTRKRCVIVAHLVLSVLSCVFGGLYLFVSVGAMAEDIWDVTDNTRQPHVERLATLLMSQIVIAFCQMVTGVGSAWLCCSVVCCTRMRKVPEYITHEQDQSSSEFKRD